MQLKILTDRLDDRLRTDAYADLDASPNGLQVGDAGDVDRVAVAVDAAEATIEEAVEAGADLLVVHHGLIWDGLERVTGRDHRRIAALIENDLALYVSHLPLDGHQELGNAAGVADLLGLDDREPFGEIGPEYLGQRGTLPEARPTQAIRETLAGDLDHAGEGVQVLDFGPEDIEEVAVLTGSGADWLAEAIDLGVDAFVTGEGKQQVYHEAREAGITVFLAGHYATETFGVRALQDLVADWGIETTYIHHPTGL